VSPPGGRAAQPPLICLLGPTASGKTELAIELAQARNCELISVDSALVYRGLDIGSAKPDYPHHLVDIRDPAEIYSAADFVADARRLCAEITVRGRIPLLVGGTMLYFKAFLEGLAEMPGADARIRVEIEQLAAARGWPTVHAELARVDPEAAQRIHPNHSQRLSRALEVYRISGIPLSQWQQHRSDWLPGQHYNIVQLAICPAHREELHRRIALRFQQMMEAGLLDEVRGLRQRGDLHPDLPAVRAVGYRQLWQYLDATESLDHAVERAVAATRQLAKRQLTWLRKWGDLSRIYTDNAGNGHESLEAALASEDADPPRNGEKILTIALKYMKRASI